MADFDDDPALFAAIGLAIAGFEIPDDGDDAEPGKDFSLIYSVDREVELAIRFIADERRFDVEARLLAAHDTAVRTAALLLARATGDIRCTVDPEDDAFCMTRSMDWRADSTPDDLALMAAEFSAAAVELAQARASGEPTGYRHDPAADASLIIRG